VGSGPIASRRIEAPIEAFDSARFKGRQSAAMLPE
jgi:hypothetical protein